MYIYIYIYIYIYHACDRGCAASVGLLVTGKEKGESKKRTTDSKSTQLMGMQGIIMEMCVCVCVWRGGVNELH